MRRYLGIITFVAAIVGMLSGCTGGQHTSDYHPEISGSPQTGKAVIEQFRCGRCHTIPGIPNAHGVFGPPLNLMSRRTFIAGEFPNTPPNLVRWVQSPTSMKPKTAMPDLGLTDDQATDVVAYLEKLR
jgi:cytochrome c